MTISAYAIPGIDRVLVMDSELEIIHKIADYYKIPVKKILHRMRGTQDVVYARDWCIWFLLKMKPAKSLKEIGRIMLRDHTTIIHAREKVRGHLYHSNDPEYYSYKDDYEKLLFLIDKPIDF